MEESINHLPLYCLPNLDYLTRILNGSEVDISLGETFEKQTFRSRFEIGGPNGRQLLSIPLIHSSCHSSKAQVIIDHRQNWQVKHWRSIETAYRRAPFFEHYSHYFEKLFSNQYCLLAEFNIEALQLLIKILKIERRVKLNTQFQPTLRFKDGLVTKSYQQVFISKNGFIPNLSAIDLIFNMGPSSLDYLIPD